MEKVDCHSFPRIFAGHKRGGARIFLSLFALKRALFSPILSPFSLKKSPFSLF
jgi:hypothetical protein